MITRGTPRVRQSTLPPPAVDHLPFQSPPSLQPLPPQWVRAVMPNPRTYEVAGVHATESAPLVLLTTVVPRARLMGGEALRSAVAHAYGAIGGALRATRTNAIRFWNYLPDPNHLMAPGLDRYMVFNAGRHDGYRGWFSEEEPYGTSLATASAVGVEGDDLAVHCLASDRPGRAVENPRQKPAWQYSARYGPMPPSFSRATVASLRERHLLLIGGTASIVGEDSVHIGDVGAQIDETLNNLATLVAAAAGAGEPSAMPLARINDLRIYITRPGDASLIGAAVRRRCPGATRIEMATARLCRPELLVEIEGVAEIPAAPTEAGGAG
jgi:chorismate lyase/3-hydroxybenzoate synthase